MKLPFTFGIKFIFRLLLPGFILAIALYPMGAKIIHFLGASIDYIEFVSICTVICGWLMVVLDMQIYMLFEGRRYWPSSLWNLFLKMEQCRLLKLRKTIRRNRPRRAICKPRKADEHVYLEASVDCRGFPIDGDTGKYTVVLPTRLGNLIYSYEEYPKRVYRLDAPFFWTRIWVKMDKDLREELDEAQSIADSILYTCVALYLSSGLSFFYWVMSCINLPFEILSGPPTTLVAVGFVTFIFAQILYQASFFAHARYGELFKAVFDLYSNDLSFPQAEKELEWVLKDRSKKEQHQIIWRYLNNYRIKDPVTGRFLTPRQWEVRSKEAAQEISEAGHAPKRLIRKNKKTGQFLFWIFK